MKNQATVKAAIEQGKTALGIEFGSTRIKAVLINQNYEPIASGSHEWENRLDNGIWTYTMDDVWQGLQSCYADLVKDVKASYDVELTRIGALGFSAMMHGYLAFDKQDALLVPFRTWRNTTTGQAAEELTELFQFNIPQRWSIAHLYQVMLNQESHAKEIGFVTTLAGYVHWKLTGRKALGVGDASGMFPIDSATGKYNTRMMGAFDKKAAAMGMPWQLENVLPEILSAGENAGLLTAEGAKLLDPSGKLQPGIVLCPPEGDAGTGMTATNAVALRTGNVSAGTSIFAMVVLEKELEKVHVEIDMVTTPTGRPVAMVHCNNCTSDLNAWVGLFDQFSKTMGMKVDMNTLYGNLYRAALEGDKDCGGLMAYNYYSGEPITGLEEGRPLFVRTPDAKFTLANFMRTHLYSALATLALGMDILLKEEKVQIDQIFGHGGLFKTKGVGQKMMAASINTSVSVMETAGEGGPWGMALLAAYAVEKQPGQALEAYLNDQVFGGMAAETAAPDQADVAGFQAFLAKYAAGIPMEKAAVEVFR